MKEIKINLDGTEFVIINNNGMYSYYKLVNGVQMIPSIQELRLIVAELQKMNNVAYSLDELKNIIYEQIVNGNIKNQNDLNDYIDNLKITDNIEELRNYGILELEKLNVQLTPTEELKEEILDIIKNNKDDEKQMHISFDLKNGLDNEYMEITLTSKKDDVIYEYPKKYVAFDENTKRNLLEPIMREIILKNKITYNKSFNINSIANYRANYFLRTTNNYFFDVLNIEQYYAVELEDMMYNLQDKYGYENEEERIEEINEELDKENLYLDKEKNRMLDNNLKLVRTKKENNNSGYVNLLVIVASEFFAGLFILLQILLS